MDSLFTSKFSKQRRPFGSGENLDAFLKRHLINDPFNWTKHPKKWDPNTKKYSKKNHPEIQQHQKNRTAWRQLLQQHTWNQCKIVLHNDRWHK